MSSSYFSWNKIQSLKNIHVLTKNSSNSYTPIFTSKLLLFSKLQLIDNNNNNNSINKYYDALELKWKISEVIARNLQNAMQI